MKRAFALLGVLLTSCTSAAPIAAVPEAPAAVAPAPPASGAAVTSAPAVPEGCFGAQLLLTDALAARCASDADARPEPLDAGVHLTLTSKEATVAPGGTVTLVLRVSNDTDAPRSLWFFSRLTRPGFKPLDFFSASATDAQGRSVETPRVDDLGPGGFGSSHKPPPGPHVVLAPRGVATAEIPWVSSGYPQDEVAPAPPQPKPSAKPAPPKKAVSPEQAVRDVAAFGLLSGAPARQPLAPGVYHVTLHTSIVGAPEVAADVRVK